jgi:murein endopeptidase/LysM repeat protein
MTRVVHSRLLKWIVAYGLVPIGVAGADDADANDAATDRTGAAKPTATFITHKVVPFETRESIATRYGVTVRDLEAWNKKLKKSAHLMAGWDLKVRARIAAPPRQKITYAVKFGDTWGEIATKFNVPETHLHQWNRKVPRQFKAGQKITVYTNPKAPPVRLASTEPIDPSSGLALAGAGGVSVTPRTFDVPRGGVSLGSPNRGRLTGGVQLPESDLYTIRRPEESYGSSHTILEIQEAIAAFRDTSGYEGKLIVGAISLERGGRFRPHRSHQSGRDVDIRLPKVAGADPKSDSPSDIDWDASWKLVQAFIEQGDAEYIFLDYSRQKRLYEAAKRAGADKATLEKAIQYPRSRKTNNGVLRHAEGHLIHIHVRVNCPRDQARCES